MCTDDHMCTLQGIKVQIFYKWEPEFALLTVTFMEKVQNKLTEMVIRTRI